MLTRKKTLAILIIIILITIGAILIFRKRNISAPQVVSIEQPKIKNSLTSTFPIESQLDKTKTQIPASLPIYKLDQTPLSDQRGQNLATSLGFKSSPTVLTDKQYGKVLLWNENNETLWISTGLKIISYNTNVSPSNLGISFPSDNELTELAKNFIAKTSLVKLADLNFLSIQYLNGQQEALFGTTKDKADFAYVIFEQRINGYPIVSSAPNIGTMNIRIDRNKKIIAFDATIVDYSPQSNTFYPIKTFEELKATVPEAKVQDIDVSASSDIAKISIAEAHVAYLREYSLNQTILQPIFVLKGVVSTKTSSTTFSTTLYLPAISNKYLFSIPSPTPAL